MVGVGGDVGFFWGGSYANAFVFLFLLGSTFYYYYFLIWHYALRTKQYPPRTILTQDTRYFMYWYAHWQAHR